MLYRLSDRLCQEDGRSLADRLRHLDLGALPGHLPQRDWATLDPDLAAACQTAAQFLKKQAFQNPEIVPSDAYDWAIRALVTAYRHELAYFRKVRKEVDVSDPSQLWRLWLPH